MCVFTVCSSAGRICLCFINVAQVKNKMFKPGDDELNGGIGLFGCFFWCGFFFIIIFFTIPKNACLVILVN